MSSKKKKGKKKAISSTFDIGDVVLFQAKRKEKELARIRWVGMTQLSKKLMYGIEYLKYRVGTHEVLGSKIMDGKIGGKHNIAFFKTNKKGYGTFVDSITLNRSCELKWNRKISDKYMKAKRFDKKKFMDAAQYGSSKVVKHFLSLLNEKTYNKSKVLKELQNAIEFNHNVIVQNIFEHHFGFQYNNDESKDDEKKLDNNHNKCIFFDQESLANIIKNKNRKILDLVLFFDKWPVIKQCNYISNAAIYTLFSTKGNLSFIKYFIQKISEYKDEKTMRMYFNFPLMQRVMNINSTITIAAIKGNRWNYLEYLLVENKFKQLIRLQPEISAGKERPESKEGQPDVYIADTSPLLLCLVMSMKTHKALTNVEKFAKIMLNMNANINCFPDISLSQQLQNGNGESIQKIINTTLGKTAQVINTSNLFYYDIGKKYKKSQPSFANKNHFIAGSILSAFIYQCSEVCDATNIEKQTENIKNIISLFMEYGAILYHNGVEDKFNDLVNWKHPEAYPNNMNIYIYNNKQNKMRAYWLPGAIRGESNYNYMEKILKNAFAFGIVEHKRKLKIFLQTIDMYDGLRFVFVEFLPDYVCWDLEFVDHIKSSAPSRQVTPRYYRSDSDDYWSASW